MYKLKYFLTAVISLLLLQGLAGCKKLAEVGPPKTSITQTNVFSSDASAISVMTGIYTKMVMSGTYSGNFSISALCGLSADELSLWSAQTNATMLAYYQNNLRQNTATSYYGSDFWSPCYNYIYTCNSAIEQLSAATTESLSGPVKKQLMGEAKFIRALNYFYLVNLFGDVPIALSSNYTVNGLLARSSKQIVWQQIISDLKDAMALLSSTYLDATLLGTTVERIRPTSWAATALLARAYLYTGDYVQAEAQASAIINNTSLYSPASLNNVFLKNSTEAIWQLQPVGAGSLINTYDGYYFIIPSTGPSSTFTFNINPDLMNSFEVGDNRKTSWVGKYTSGSTIVYYPSKYKQNASGVPTAGTQTEYLMMLRLAEQYLIRAEARVRMNNISGAVTDLNVLRTRARGSLPGDLPNLLSTMTSQQALDAVAHERRVELFTELGHRWIDLKRTGVVDSVMTVQCVLKGGLPWNTRQQLYPLLQADVLADPNLVQNSY